MSSVFYIKKFKDVLNCDQDDPEESHWRKRREDLLNNSIDTEERELIPLLDMRVEFICPLKRAVGHIYQRTKEDDIAQNNNWQNSPSSDKLLTIEELFNKLTCDVSPDTAKRTINNLDCTPIIKSDLLHCIETVNFVAFDKLIRDNNIDFDCGQNICSHITSWQDTRESLYKDIDDFIKTKGINQTPEELKLCSCEILDIISDNYDKMLKQEGVPEEEAEIAKSVFLEQEKEIVRLLNKGMIKEAWIPEILVQSVLVLAALQQLHVEKKLLRSEVRRLQAFVQERKNNSPMIAGIISMITEGEFLTDNFSITQENVDYYHLNNLICESAKNIQPQRATNRMIEHQPMIPSLAQEKNVKSKYCLSNGFCFEEKYAQYVDDEVINVLNNAIEKSLISQKLDGENLKWNASRTLCEYLFRLLFAKDHPEEQGKNQTKWCSGGKLDSFWGDVIVIYKQNGEKSQMEFGVTRRKYTAENGKFLPNEHEKIEALFSESWRKNNHWELKKEAAH